MQDVISRYHLGVTAPVVLPEALIDVVVEVVILHVLELGAGGGEELFDNLDVVVHRSANVKEHQQFYRVAPLWPGLDVEISMFGGGSDRTGQVQLFFSALTNPASQPLQRNFDVAGTKLDAVIEIAKLALVPDLDRPAMTAFGLADAHAFRVIAIGAEG